MGRSWWLISSTWLGSIPPGGQFWQLSIGLPTGGHLGHHIWEEPPCLLISTTWNGSPLVVHVGNLTQDCPLMANLSKQGDIPHFPAKFPLDYVLQAFILGLVPRLVTCAPSSENSLTMASSEICFSDDCRTSELSLLLRCSGQPGQGRPK